MKVILKEDIHGLGYKDDVVTVKDGYGRNYLIPQQKAVLATEAAQKIIAENNKQRAHKLAKIKAEAEELAAKLNDITVSVVTKASEKGKVFGAITSMQIAEALEKQGIVVEKRLIELKNPIKELGNFKVSAKLHKEVSAEFTVEVSAAE